MKLSKDQITIIPNHLSEDNEFNVTVINDSDKFASFQLELNAPGLEDKSDFKWYKIEPKICTKKPPGSETEFRVAITKPPIPAYNKTIDLDVKAFSVEDDKFESEKIKLKIENPLPKIELKLLYEKFDKIDAKPGQKIDIPVIITNLSSNLTNVQLQLFANLPTSEANSEVILPTRPKVLNIPLEIPNDAKLGEYEFIIRDVSDNNYSQSNKKDRPYVKGILNILPHGIIELKCDNPVQEIPCVENNTENNQIDTVIYKLEFINKFHLEEAVDIDVHIREKNVKTIDYNTSGSFTLSSQQQKEELIINARLTEKRPLFGWKRQFTIVAKPYCKSNNQVKFQPKTQRLVLNVSPTIPFWLQLLGLISIPLLIISLFNYFTFPRHDAPVTSIGISDLGGTVISGSSDRTIRRWQVDDSWFGNNRGLKFEDILAKDSDIPKAVRVIRFLPKNHSVVAVGLENGEIHLWDLSSGKAIKKPLLEGKDKGNRVFDLGFTKNSQTLIAVYGDGNIKNWNISNIESKTKEVIDSSKKAEFTISTLGISENDQLPLVVVGGRFNKLGFWDWNNEKESEMYHLPYYEKKSKKSNLIQPINGQHRANASNFTKF